MAVTTFASVYIGSYEVNLKIFEFNPKRGVREIDCLRSHVELGRNVFRNGAISYEMVDEICLILNEFRTVIDSYMVTDYKVYASAILREASNQLFVQNQILLRTGFKVEIISNSEHRFISYKAVASQENFEKMIQTSAAVVDVGGVSVQITLFKEGKLVTTQRIKVGSMQLRSLLEQPGVTQEHYQQQLKEYIDKHFDAYRSFYLEDASVDSIIFLSDYGVDLMKALEKENGKAKEVIKAERFAEYMQKLQQMPLYSITRELNLSDDSDALILPSIVLFSSLISHLSPKTVWFPGVDINDGIAMDYGQSHQLIRTGHDFEADVRSATRQLAEHYHCYDAHTESMVNLSLQLFDTLKKVHGLQKRERLLLEVATLLHESGRYISFTENARCAYEIVRSSEIIGISHREREVVACTVRYSWIALADYEELSDRLTKEEYVTMAKMAAILRVANALDQSHRQKFSDVRISLKDRELVITVDAAEDISLEQILFNDKTTVFENVFSLKPVLKARKIRRTGKK